MFGLIPKEEKFFAMFKEMTSNMIVAAEGLKDMLHHWADPVASQRRIKDLEHKGDTITHNIIDKLNKSFVTPFDREDIYALSGKLDDVLDFIDGAATRFVLYKVTRPTPESKEIAFLILKGCQAIDKAVSLLGQQRDSISQYCVEANALENEADRVLRDAIGRLFEEEKDPIQLIKWKEIYEFMERATDKVEDAANILESIVVKNG